MEQLVRKYTIDRSRQSPEATYPMHLRLRTRALSSNGPEKRQVTPLWSSWPFRSIGAGTPLIPILGYSGAVIKPSAGTIGPRSTFLDANLLPNTRLFLLQSQPITVTQTATELHVPRGRVWTYISTSGGDGFEGTRDR